MPRLVEQHSGPRALWEQWLSTYIASITAQLIDGLYGGCFQRGALPALQQEIKNALGVKRREILSRHTRQFVFPRGLPHISLHVLGGNLVFALVPGGLTSPSLALFFSFLFLFLKLWSVSPKLGANETTVLFLKAALTSQVVLSKKQNKKQTNNTKCNLYKEAGCWRFFVCLSVFAWNSCKSSFQNHFLAVWEFGDQSEFFKAASRHCSTPEVVSYDFNMKHYAILVLPAVDWLRWVQTCTVRHRRRHGGE